MDRMIRGVLLAFVVVGVLVAGGAGWWAQTTRAFAASAERVQGTVIRLDEVRRDRDKLYYYPVVSYRTLAGEERTLRSSYGTYPPAYEVGETVDVLYADDDPRSGRIDGTGSLYLGPMILGGLAAVFVLVGGIGTGTLAYRARRRARVRFTGMHVVTAFQGVERNEGISFNGRHPWRIVTQWQDPRTGLLHVFRSEDLWFDPTAYVDRKEIAVFIDPADPRRHAMDVSFLPKVAA